MSAPEAVAAAFAKDTAGFEVRVLSDAGEYKTVLFGDHGHAGFGHTMVHVYPGGVSTSGDMAHGWVFERDIEFFGRSISPRYWQEKLASTLREARAHLEFDPHVFRASVDEIAEEANVPEEARDALRAELAELVDSVINDRPSVDFAIDALTDFSYEYADECGEDRSFTLDEAYATDCESFDYHFLWTLHVLHAVANALSDHRSR